MPKPFYFVKLEDALHPDTYKRDQALLRAIPTVIAGQELAFEQSRGNLLDPLVRVDRILVRTEFGRSRGQRLSKARKRISFIDRGGERVREGKRNKGQVRTRARSAAQLAWSVIQKLSPRDSGEYRSANTMFYNGKEYPGGSLIPKLNTTADTIVMVNRMPYAKRLEGVRYRKSSSLSMNRVFARNAVKLRGLKGSERAAAQRQNKLAKRGIAVTAESSKYMSARAPNGIYNVAAAKINRELRGYVIAQFVYLEVAQFYDRSYGKNKQGSKYGNQNRTGAFGGDKGIVRRFYAASGRPLVFPAIILTLDNASGLAPDESQGPFRDRAPGQGDLYQ